MEAIAKTAYPLCDRAGVFVRAVFRGKDPMVEIALEGLSRPGLEEGLQLIYARRVLERGELRGFFESAKANPEMIPEANGMAVLAVERNSERLIRSERSRAVFVYDEQ